MKTRKIAKSRAISAKLCDCNIRKRKAARISELAEWDVADFLTDEETIAAFLAEAACDPDPAFYQSALEDVARARAKNTKSD